MRNDPSSEADPSQYPGHPAPRRSFEPPPSVVPLDLKLKLKDQTLTMTWKDGTTSTLPLGYLRKNCPCATCRSQREDTSLLPVLKINPNQEPPKVTHAQMAGNYALQLHWSDGHNTGIFDFRTLRDLADRFNPRPPA